jgi:hypothetical protein
MKHVSATTMDNTSVGGQKNSANANDDVLQSVSTFQSELLCASKKNKFQDQTLHYFGNMVDTGVAMLDHFARTNELLQKVDQPRGGHYIVKLRTTCEQKKSTFSKLHHQNGSKFYQIFFMSRYTWYLLHGKN